MRSVAKARLLLTTKLNSTAAVGTQQAAASAISPVSWKPSASLHSAVDSTHNTAGTSHPPEGGFSAALAAAAANKNWEKGRSKQTQSNSLPNRQANLAVLAFGAVVVSANTHEVPITGRRQFILGLTQTLPASRSSSGHLPEDAELYRHETGPAWHALQEQGLQVMQSMYQTAALGVAKLAAADTVLQKRLQLLPNRIVLQHDVNHIYPQASIKLITEGQYGELSGGLYTKWLFGQQQHMRIQATGGSLLLCQTREEGVGSMSHELAHGIACHSAEQGSWLLMPLLLGVARFTLGICSAWSQLAIPLLLLQLTSFFLVGVWLSQQLEYEADAIGAVISKAAGCSPESIVESMQRWHAVTVALRMMNNKTCADSASLQMQEGLAALHQLLPSKQHLPALVNTSNEHFAQLVKEEFKHAPSEVHEKAAVLLAQMQHSLGKSLFVHRDLLQDRFSSHPHCLDRIKKVEELLASLAHEQVAPNVPEGMSTKCGDELGVHTSPGLSEYHAADRWSQLLHQEDCIEAWIHLRQIRCYQPSALKVCMNLGALELFDKEVQDIAWKEAVSRNKAIQQLLKHLKDASFIL